MHDARSIAVAVAPAVLSPAGGLGRRCAAATDAEQPAATRSIRLVLFGDPTETAGYETLVEEFEAANADVDVQLGPVASQDDLLASSPRRSPAASPPDVFLINYRRYGQFAAAGRARAGRSPASTSSEVIAEDDFARAALDAFRFDGTS